jgi:hypothetical protein
METRSGAQPNLQRELHLVYDSMLGGYSIRGGTRSRVRFDLPCEVDGPCLPNHDHFDLSRILELFLDATGYDL